jgi:hypothetical protein
VLATPAAALLPLTATNLGDKENPCVPLLKQIQQTPVPSAPPKKSQRTAAIAHRP